jgi:hypothetical protein
MAAGSGYFESSFGMLLSDNLIKLRDCGDWPGDGWLPLLQ